ncbi:Integrase [Rhodospirillales bacterium URHD0017]|nr:Integrase [Rhodospirillales bacterium URHD0017]
MPKLTKSYVDKVQPKAADALHWDSELKGFGLRVTPARKLSFIVQGRVGTAGRASPTVRLTIGPYGVFTVDQARDAARERLRDMRMGIDPRAAASRSAAQRKTLQDVADDYLEQRPLKPRSKRAIEQAVAGPFKAFGWTDKPLANISRANVSEAFMEMRERAPVHANTAFGILRAIVNFAINEYVDKDGSPIIKDNPVKALYRKWAHVTPRTGRVPDDKLGAVWKHLEAARQRAHNGHTGAALDLICFLLLTGCRLSEAAELTWDRVNLEEGWWHLPDPKNRNPVWLPLPTQAMELLRSRATRQGYVFGSYNGHIKDPRDSMKNLSAVAGCKLTPHDLRRTFTHVGVASCSIEIVKVELLTNHIPQSVTARHYMETSKLQYLKPQVQQIADAIVGA